MNDGRWNDHNLTTICTYTVMMMEMFIQLWINLCETKRKGKKHEGEKRGGIELMGDGWLCTYILDPN
jgi:hypothetical protein